MEADYSARAERFIRGVYGGDPSVVDDLAASSIVISYPIFERIYQTPVLRGRDAARTLCARFSSRWADARITIDEAIAAGDRVVLVWSFQARNVGQGPGGEPPSDTVERWGGISLFRFDKSGRILAEIGEESAPGPMGRLAQSGPAT